uniref:Uncharacterized protein n=1 Tax=Plectus sambesii TaxID=2011161 RepID=A0A914X4V4_9BILA
MKDLAIFLCVLLISTTVICNPIATNSRSSEEQMPGPDAEVSGPDEHGIREERGLKGALAGAALGAIAGHYAQNHFGRGSGSSTGSGMGSGMGNNMGNNMGNGMGNGMGGNLRDD